MSHCTLVTSASKLSMDDTHHQNRRDDMQHRQKRTRRCATKLWPTSEASRKSSLGPCGTDMISWRTWNMIEGSSVLLVFEGNDRVGRGHCMLANDHQVCCRCLLLPHRGWMKIENRFERLIVRDDRPFFVRTCIRPYTASHEDASSLSQLITRLSRIYFIRSIVAYQPF
jgi:hypothetical protein